MRLNTGLFRLMLAGALVLSLGFSGWQYSRWGRTEAYWASIYVGDLKNAVIRFDQLKGITDSGERSLAMPWVAGRQSGAVTTGEVLDVMVQHGSPQRVGILGRAQWELDFFARSLWIVRGLKPPSAGSRQNDLLPAADLDKLAQVWSIYRDHFSQAVVSSLNYDRQRLALVEVHQQLKDQGLTKLLIQPDALDSGLTP